MKKVILIGGWVIFFSKLLEAKSEEILCSSTLLYPHIITQLDEGPNIPADFALVEASFALLHTCLVPLRFGIEKDGIYKGKWEAMLPVCVVDFVFGLLGGHLGGKICNGWVERYEHRGKTFAKAFVSGLFAGAVWGAASCTAWEVATRNYPDTGKYRNYNLLFYGSVGLNIFISSIGQGVLRIFVR